MAGSAVAFVCGRIGKGEKMNFANVFAASTDSIIPLLRSMLPRVGAEPAEETFLSQQTGVRAVGHRQFPLDETFALAWNDLLSRVPGATVFQTSHWQQAATAWPQRLDRLLLLAVWRGSHLIGVLPLQTARGARVESAGAIVSDYLDPLIDPNFEEEAWRAIFAFLRKYPAAAKGLSLRNIRPEASCRSVLTRIGNEEGFAVQEEQAGTSCFLKLPKTWDEYLASLKGGDRKELRRKIAKAESQGGAVLEPETDAAGNLDRANRVFGLIEAAGGKRAMKCRWIFRNLLDASGPAMAEEQWLRVFSLKINDRPSAGVITFRTPGGPMGWATAYNEADKALSPGIVVFAMAIRRAIEEGAQYFDLLRGDSDYKTRLGAETRPLYELTLRPSRLMS
jgi:CelD/BcsL family acetyltransferase involved in cellulose biosynthesis